MFWSLLHTHPCDIIDPKQPGDDIIICGPGEQLYRHGSKLLHACFRPVLQTRLREKESMIKQAYQKWCVSRNFKYQPNLNHVDPECTVRLLRMNTWMLCVQDNELGLCLCSTFLTSFLKKYKQNKRKQTNSAPPIRICICYLFILSNLFIFGYIPPSSSKLLSASQFILIHDTPSFGAYLCLNLHFKVGGR